MLLSSSLLLYIETYSVSFGVFFYMHSCLFIYDCSMLLFVLLTLMMMTNDEWWIEWAEGSYYIDSTLTPRDAALHLDGTQCAFVKQPRAPSFAHTHTHIHTVDNEPFYWFLLFCAIELYWNGMFPEGCLPILYHKYI